MEHLPSHVPRIKGLETEYGIHPQPTTIAYKELRDAEPETIRSLSEAGFLDNGGRLYVDQSKNIEYATPETLSDDGLLEAHFSGEDLVKETVEKMYPENSRRAAYKRSIDCAMDSRGEHENYLTGSEELPARIADMLLPHLVTRIVITGPGMVLSGPSERGIYSIDQRAWNLDVPLKSSATNKAKPFILDRHEPFDLTEKTNRLQVVSGSENMFAFPVLARLMTTSLVLRLIEADAYPKHLTLHDPLRAGDTMRSITTDIKLTSKPVKLANSQKLSALEVQYELASAACEFADKNEIPEDERMMAYLWRDMVGDLMNGDIEKWKTHIEWLAKLLYLENKMLKENISLGHPRTVMREIKWHELSDDSVVYKLRKAGAIAMMPDDASIMAAKSFPPDPTRARLRARSLKEKTNNVTEINWNGWRIKGRMHRVNNAYQSC
jgi:hypothetical protein